MTTSPSDLFRSAYEASIERGAGTLRDVRRAAYHRFQSLGLPTSRDEDWRSTSLAALSRTAFAAATPGAAVTLEDLKPLTFGTLGRYRAVFVDGQLMPALSTLDALPAGVTVARYAEAASRLSPEGSAAIAGMSDALDALNLALANDGALVGLVGRVVLGEPLYLYFYSTLAAGDTPVAAVRNLVFATSGSQMKVVEAYGGTAGARYLSSAFTHVTVQEGAVVDHVRLQRESAAAFHLSRLKVTQERGSRFAAVSVNLGAALHRHNIEVRFEGEGGECSLDGLFMANGEQHTDTHTLIDHARPHCSSRELYKGVLDGKSRGVFHGRILVRKDAQKTDAIQTNKNLLLSREALVNSTPQLEILADDVKCKHGSTTGQLDAAALFYLRSRGIDEAAARSLLTYAFASDLVKRIPVEDVRNGLEAYLQERLPVSAQEAVA